jgi:hypothetical protein
MPNLTTKQMAERDLAEGKSPSTVAGEFVREEMHHIREGKHGAKNTKQAIAIGLSKARRAGVPAKPRSTASERIQKKGAEDAARVGQEPNPNRVRAGKQALEKKPHAAASFAALSRHAKASAERRRKAGGPNSPAAAARRAARTRRRIAP